MANARKAHAFASMFAMQAWLLQRNLFAFHRVHQVVHRHIPIQLVHLG